MTLLSRISTLASGLMAGSYRYSRQSFSQEGEDVALMRLFPDYKRRAGTYIEVGSHHPFRFSNTYAFYLAGWTGVCVDPNPVTAKQFKRSRPRDAFVLAGVAREPSIKKYFSFEESALNTFDDELARSRELADGYRLLESRNTVLLPLTDIVHAHLPQRTKIDFLSVDAEGMDFEILTSHDWDLFRPKCVVVESLGFSLERMQDDATLAFMSSQNYILHAKTGSSLIFVGID